ncbi:hypothetical protein Y032_0477g2173 [Ancylostoma ceylanicum]|uniref:Uncharacterized protein n=1 Tax=Ancylostoma ceylanicum TaxID=53326 RepID=A0A016WW59_9BILA|nr:hypothetical protein Y032_0477g2173 [Ancylostoma ceylanicum]
MFQTIVIVEIFGVCLSEFSHFIVPSLQRLINVLVVIEFKVLAMSSEMKLEGIKSQEMFCTLVTLAINR